MKLKAIKAKVVDVFEKDVEIAGKPIKKFFIKLENGWVLHTFSQKYKDAKGKIEEFVYDEDSLYVDPKETVFYKIVEKVPSIEIFKEIKRLEKMVFEIYQKVVEK